MKELSYRIERGCAAPPALVYGVFADVERWPTWMPGVRRAAWDVEGPAGGAGEGAIRRFGAPGVTARERIVVADPPHHQGYTLLSGLPLDDYRADVHIDERPGGSLIRWEATFRSRIPVVGKLLEALMTLAMTGAARALAKEAERQHRLP